MNNKEKIVYLPSNISFLRNKHKMSTIKLAKLLNYRSGSTITNWESGIRVPDVFDTWRLAKLFDVSIDDFIKKDLRFEDQEYLDKVIRNIKELDTKQQKEILDIMDVLIKSKMINLSEEKGD